MERIIDGHTGLMGLLGSPVEHSISPMMHNMALEKLELNYVYLGFDVDEQGLETAVAGLKKIGIRGFNLTMPDKNKMAELVDELSPAAKLIGAVNTVVNKDGQLIGHNTDGVGFMRSVKEAGYDIIGGEMTLMGAGGAATAICVQAALDGVKKLNLFARPSSRFHERTVQLVENIGQTTACEITLFDQADTETLRRCLRESQILVNATSVGMAPNVEGSIIEDTTMFHPGLIVSDIIYNPKETRLLREAKKAGCHTFNGMYMLLYQGAEAFKLWTGMEMPIELLKEKLFQ